MSRLANHPSPPHVALLSSAGMGHLTPILRLAAMLDSHNCRITLITAQPPFSTAEATHISAFLTAHPKINTLTFQLIPYTPPEPTTTDPFLIQYESMSRSVHLLTPLLSSTSSPLSAIISDIASSGGTCQVADDLNLPHFILSTTSARFTSFVLNLPSLLSPETNSITTPETTTRINIPGLPPFDTSTIPQPFFIPNHIFTNLVVSSSLALQKATGVLIDTFHELEPETINAINTAGKLVTPFLPIGPLQPHNLKTGNHQPLTWLDQQPLNSVVYICFGNRTALSKDQITELAKGLEQTGLRFLWVLKFKIVDKEDTEEVESLLGDSFIQRTRNMGMVVKGWVDQEAILSHGAIGCFLSHSGWNSVIEAVSRGVPMVGWPGGGDQKVNAVVMEVAGVGVWDKGWGWIGEKVVKGEEITKKVKMVMSDEKMGERVRKVAKEASDAVKDGGSGNKVLMEMIMSLK